MRTALILAASAFALTAQAGVTVTFVEPDRYTDVGRFSHSNRSAEVMKDLEAHLVKLGRRMPPGQDLAIEVLDIDLAGEERFHSGGANDVRVLRGRADWPSIRLRYTLERDGLAKGPADHMLLRARRRASPLVRNRTSPPVHAGPVPVHPAAA